MRTVASLLIALFSIAAGPAPPSSAYQALRSARSLRCEFGPGNGASWDRGKVRVISGTFGVGSKTGTAHYDSIDVSAGKARFIANQGAFDIEVKADAIGLTFFERPELGGLIITTVFATGEFSGLYPAVFTKHVDTGVPSPMPQQYYGSCRIWQ